ncbi:MAG: hypothetical protein IJ736_09665 [Firmicutes bacterium]|nr:hypothetical protein [Bacillota bacterium]
MNIEQFSPQSGRYVDEDGTVRNFVDELLAAGSAAEPVDTVKVDIKKFSPRSGRFIAEDGSVYNLADLLSGIGGTIDTSMSESSTNAVQNKVIKKYIDDAIAAITDYEGVDF